MKVNTRGQVTIPSHIRTKLGISASTEVDFVEQGDRVYLVKRGKEQRATGTFAHLRNVATVRMSTDEIMALTR